MAFDLLKDIDKKVHFIGIGGVSMSGLAAVLLNAGYKVSGSDSKESEITNRLIEEGAKIYIGHSKDNLQDVDVVVYTAAIPSDNPEIVKAKEDNLILMDRAEFLGQIMKGHKFNVAVAGTHGKTTTTSMISHVALSADLDPTILVGGDLDIIHGNFRVGNSEYFITEACEYKQSFLRFFPYVGIILNIDADHLDFYKDINHIKDTFKQFVNLIPNDGYIIGNADDKKVLEVLDGAKCNVLTYGINAGDIQAKNIEFNEKGCATFDVFKGEEKLLSLSLNVPGMHNVSNSLSAVCLSEIFKIPAESVISGLSSFGGAHKRFEYKGKKNDITVIDDYAHHPVEIKATLSTAKKMSHNKTICVFQPHTYTRTKTLFDDFVKCFDDCDELILMDIYAAREKDLGEINSDQLGDAIRAHGVKCINVHSHEEALEYVKANSSKGDLLLTVGAGDVVKVGELFLK
ncbi:UDP-N-acetylmuramate--L-alanine ligase [Clostridium sp. LIBA-8841]|uniref:UDP-N-acetylmuramate--L-alanine ligase n=1 Tax=Clostridium sp. LIBA-8841 TaxID=2987530 RepID=UPI002AC42B04|nr:UDP-N-acetylmuramate--L-alanine ligase [Clostridium sp. LIBA-8841]MDZ5254679.1 UDP-N-acetylmuramate--L-alanine ligase [Clostridium sp. LIBA-8841]